MTRGGFRTQADAEAKWDEIILNPGEAAYVYVGMQELLDMEKDYKQLKGDSFISQGRSPLRPFTPSSFEKKTARTIRSINRAKNFDLKALAFYPVRSEF
jgi:hypothetical protein